MIGYIFAPLARHGCYLPPQPGCAVSSPDCASALAVSAPLSVARYQMLQELAVSRAALLKPGRLRSCLSMSLGAHDASAAAHFGVSDVWRHPGSRVCDW